MSPWLFCRQNKGNKQIKAICISAWKSKQTLRKFQMLKQTSKWSITCAVYTNLVQKT